MLGWFAFHVSPPESWLVQRAATIRALHQVDVRTPPASPWPVPTVGLREARVRRHAARVRSSR